MKQSLSLIVPTWNEEGNVFKLVTRIHAALTAQKITYEIIIVDDHSTDNTMQVVSDLAKDFPVFHKTKKGKQGKAHSLVEGFEYAKYDIVCMIDADLQYPPEAIPAMLEKIENGADIVVSNRKKYQSSKFRKFLSTSFRKVFGKVFFGLDHDVQSGLKVFKKDILQIIPLNPESGWTFDLEFLHRANHAAFRIESHDITFDGRTSGKSKVSFLRTSWEIGSNALKTRLKPIQPIHVEPTTKNAMVGAGLRFKKRKYVTHTTLPHKASAVKTFHENQQITIAFLAILFVAAVIYDPLKALLGFVAVLSAIYFIDVLFNLYLVWKSLYFEKALSFTDQEISKLEDDTLPVYSILCPLYKEAHVIPQFVEAISKLEWPKNKLDVMLLLEEDDIESIEAVKYMSLPSFVRTVIVPDSQPKTKPKACNYGLAHAKGEYLVIFDAEDIPDPLQLKKAYLGFKKAGKDVLCLQAKLNYYNPHHNLLTRLFTAEYSLWFDVSLTGLQALNTTIPLGGTSNHFRVKDIKALQGWDPFNVTEDADLGIRLFKKGYKTAIIDSTTLEEANSKVKNWIRQRSRWIKGYMQTYLVHTRELFGFKDTRKRHSLIFHLVIGGKIAFILINPILWLATISYFVLYQYVGTTIEYLYPSYVFYMAATSLVLGNFLFIYYYMIGAIKREQWGLIKFILLVPLYWILISIAGFMALYQLLFKPHYWEKTIHGFHLKKAFDEKQKARATTQSVVRPAVQPAYAPSAVENERKQSKWNLALFKKLLQSKKHYLSGSVLLASMMVANVLNFLFNAYLGRVLNYEIFGLLSLINSFLYLTAIPFNAIGQTMTYRSGFLEARYNSETAKYFWKSVTKRLLLISLVVSALWLASTPFLMSYFNTSEIYPILLFTPVWLVGFAAAANKGFLTGKLLFVWAGILAILDPLVKLGGAFLFVSLNLSEWVYVTIPLAVVVGYVLSALFVSRIKDEKNEQILPKQAKAFPYKFFFVALLSGLSAMTFLSLDVMLAKHFLSSEAAGQYALVSLVGKMVFFLSTLFIVFIVPFVSRNEGSKKDSSHILAKSLLISGGLAAIAFLAIGVFGTITVPLLFGAKAQTITQYLLPFTLAVGCFSVSTVFTNYYLTKRIYSFPFITFLLAIAQIIFISLFHQNIQAIVNVMVAIGAANLLFVTSLHFSIRWIKVFEDNVKDFLGIFSQTYEPLDPNKKMRILIFNWRDTKHRWAGGAEVYLHEIAKRWVQDGKNVTIFCGNDGHSPRNQVIDGVQIVRRGGFMTVYFWAFVYYVLRFRGKFDLIVDSENGIPFLTPLYVRKPIFLLIHHVHQEIFRTQLKFPLAQIASFIEGKLMPFLYKKRTIITVSESSKEEIVKLGFSDASKINVVNPGIANELFYQTEKANYPSFVYLGRLKPYKNIDVLIKAMSAVVKKAPNTKLFIAGDGESETSLKKLTETLKLGKSIKFIGKITEEQKIKLLGYSWAAVQPSQIEGWGITVIEANACGTPVIASNVNGLKDSIVDKQTGLLFSLKNVEQLTQAILKITHNRKVRNTLSQEAYQWSQNFSWDKSASDFLQILREEYNTTTYTVTGTFALQNVERK